MLRILLASILVVASGAACGSEAPAGRRDRLRIGVIPKGTTHEFWRSVHAGAAAAAAELGVDIAWKGPFREDDRTEQQRVVEDFVSAGVDGLVLAPLDETQLVGALREAAARGIPTVIIDSALAGGPQVSFVATDNLAGGALAARHLAQCMGGTGAALLLRYQVGSASTDKRERGFVETLRAEFPEIELVSDNQYGGATIESALAAAENLLVRFPDIRGVFTPNENTTVGMLRALRDAGRAGAVQFVGFDSSAMLLAALRDGAIAGLVLQDPTRIGRLGVATMVAHLRGQPVEPRIDTGVHLVTAERLATPAIQALLPADLRSR